MPDIISAAKQLNARKGNVAAADERNDPTPSSNKPRSNTVRSQGVSSANVAGTERAPLVDEGNRAFGTPSRTAPSAPKQTEAQIRAAVAAEVARMRARQATDASN